MGEFLVSVGGKASIFHDAYMLAVEILGVRKEGGVFTAEQVEHLNEGTDTFYFPFYRDIYLGD